MKEPRSTAGITHNFIYGFIESTVALISGILTIEAIYDKKELEEISHAHVVVAKNKKMWREIKWNWVWCLEVYFGEY